MEIKHNSSSVKIFNDRVENEDRHFFWNRWAKCIWPDLSEGVSSPSYVFPPVFDRREGTLVLMKVSFRKSK